MRPLQPQPSRAPAAWLVRWLIAVASLGGCTAVQDLFGTKKPDAAVATDPCDDDPYGEGCPCVDDPTQDFCPDPCTVGSPLCVQDTGDAGSNDADGGETKGDVKPDIKTDTKDSESSEIIDTLAADDIDAMRFLPEDSKQLEDGAILLPDGKVVDWKEVLAANVDVPETIVDVPEPDSEPDTPLDEVGNPIPVDTAGDGDALVNAETQDADASEVSSSDADAAEIDVGPPPACSADKDCVGPAKTCKHLKCLYSATGVAGCYYIDADNGSGCDDGKYCTVLDRCEKGACVGKAKFCAEGDDSVCTYPACEELAGGCTVKFVDSNPAVACTDYNTCTDGDYCLGGKCKAGQQNKCQCQKDGDCAGFDDGNLCNGALKCKNSECIVDPLTIVNFKNGLTCDPAKDTACQLNGCNPLNGKCELKSVPNGTGCSDNNACTAADLCVDGACKGKDKSDSCDDKNPCTDDSCDKISGCLFVSNSNLCDDGDLCSDSDKCNLGKCAGALKKVCECKTGVDCVKFEDSDYCNGTMMCKDFTCILDPKTVVNCPAGAVCAPQECQKSNGKCAANLFKVGVPCNDGDLCTLNDYCDGEGGCAPGLAVNCNDKSPCTKDVCLKDQGCVFTFDNLAPCSDGESCTYPDKCFNGGCKSGPNECECQDDAECAEKVAKFDKCKGAWTCVTDGVFKCKYDQFFTNPCKSDPSNTCTTAECIPDTGKCTSVVQPTNSTCNDGKFCTVLDHCVNGVCTGQVNSCDDGKFCTADSCDTKAAPAVACISEATKLDGLTCSDGSACTNGDLCQTGVCVGLQLDCNDSNVCTNDYCDKKNGCIYAPLPKGAGCSDGNACSGDPGNTAAGFVQDGCDGSGKCKGGDPKVCTSVEACVEIPCNPTGTSQPGIPLGCEQKEYVSDKPCNDGDSCTIGEACQIGLCAGGTPTSCDDNSACTADACDKMTGCKHTPTAAACDDGLVCTYADACTEGKCVGKTKTCDDENICTTESCDPKLGCVYKTGAGDCGDFATCSTDKIAKCVFKGGSHLLITEIYIGNPNDSSDDWVEIHNPTTGAAKVEDYVLELRAVDALPEDPWTIIAVGKKGLVMTPNSYLLWGAGTVAHGGVTIDVVDPAFKLEIALAQPSAAKECFVDTKRHASLRLRDVPHVLEHDRVAWNDGQAVKMAAGVTPADADPELWPAWASLERKATQASDNSSMYPHKPQWLAGNGFDSGDSADDFYARFWPEPYNKAGGKYEPACGGSCAISKRCNFDPAGEKCIVDSECKSFGVTSTLACGVGKICESGAAQCVPDQQGSLVLSEIHFGSGGEQFIELYNSGTKPMTIGGWRLQRKDPADQAFKPWILQLSMIAAGTILPAKKYFTLGTQEWARLHGQVDQLVLGATGLSEVGGAVRIWDPSSDTEIDLVGWGTAVTYSYAGVDGLHKAAPTPEIGQSLERKANSKSTAKTMLAGGIDSLAGNSADTGFDNNDFVLSDPVAQSLASGTYEPACAGNCQNGLVCNYVPAAEKCVDVLCGVPCDIGRGCNPKTGQCDLNLLIAEFTTDGPAAKDAGGATIFPAANEYIMLYNPSPSAISLAKTEVQSGQTVVVDGLALQYQATSGATFQKLTETNLKLTPLTGFVQPFSFYLVAPPYADVALPKPDHQAKVDWGLDSAGGVVRIVRVNGYYENNKNETDRVAYGNAAVKGENKTAVAAQVDSACSTGNGGSLRRKALTVLEGAAAGDPFKAQFYLGAALDTNDNGADWSRVPKRYPRSTKCTWPSESGKNTPFCVGYAVQQRP